MSHLLTETPHNADELTEYRTLSTSAVLALVLGFCSALAFVGPLALAVPFTAIAVALLAIARIKSAGDSLTGRPLALAAIVLAVLFATASLVRVYVRDTLAIGQATAAAQRWLTLVSTGQTDAALELLTADALMKLQPPPPMRDEPRPPFDRAKALELFSAEPLTHALEPATPGSPVTFHIRNGEFFWGPGGAQVGCQFQAQGAQAESVEGTLVLLRRATPEGDFAWLVNTPTLTKPEPRQFQDHHHHH